MSDKSLKSLVIEENIRVHAEEAPIYEIIHPQLLNWYHSRKSRKDIGYIFRLLGEERELRAVDLGCGTGLITMKLLGHPKMSVTAVDLSPEMLKELEKKLDGREKRGVTLVHKEAGEFLASQGQDSYDLITASAFLHHLVDLDEFLALACSRLKSGGILYIAYEPLKQTIDSPIRFAMHRMVRAMDVWLFNARMRRLNVEIDHDHEKSLADYQTTLGGVDLEKIVGALKGEGQILRADKFAVRANGFLALLADKVVRSQNTLSVIFRKS